MGFNRLYIYCMVLCVIPSYTDSSFESTTVFTAKPHSKAVRSPLGQVKGAAVKNGGTDVAAEKSAICLEMKYTLQKYNC